MLGLFCVFRTSYRFVPSQSQKNAVHISYKYSFKMHFNPSFYRYVFKEVSSLQNYNPHFKMYMDPQDNSKQEVIKCSLFFRPTNAQYIYIHTTNYYITMTPTYLDELASSSRRLIFYFINLRNQ